MRLLLLTSAGGAIGAGIRYGIAQWFATRELTDFPWATLLINSTGSALMGLTIGLLTGRGELTPELRAFLATGVLGGYTTFSTFSLDVWLLAERGQAASATAYVVASVVLSIAGLGLGLAAARYVVP